MEMFETVIVVVHILVSLGLIGLIMIQQGKGAEAGASFGGGASQTVFGSEGSGNFLTKSTKYLAIIFFSTSISLAVIAKQRSEVSGQEILPTASLVQKAAITPSVGDAGSDAAEVNVDLEDGVSTDLPIVEEKQTELE
jgi:preprotein translocase subunit SecG